MRCSWRARELARADAGGGGEAEARRRSGPTEAKVGSRRASSIVNGSSSRATVAASQVALWRTVPPLVGNEQCHPLLGFEIKMTPFWG
jgi:hypothetical protein